MTVLACTQVITIISVIC